MSTKPTKDLRVRRTQKWLQEALIKLMREKPYRDIQITEIADRAEVSRPTFYLHYRSKEDLLLSLVDQVFAEFFSDLVKAAANGEYRKLSLCVQFFKYWERHADKLSLVIAADIQSEIIDRMRGYLRQMLLFIKAQTGRPVADGHALDLMVGFMSSGAYALLIQWVTQKLPYSAEQMGRFLHELTISHDDVTIIEYNDPPT